MAMPLPYVPEPAFRGLSVMNEAMPAAQEQVAPIMQSIAALEGQKKQIQLDDKTKMEAQQFQKLLQQGVNGMQAYVAEIQTKHPELAQRFGKQLQSVAPLFQDPQMKREKAWEVSTWLYDSWDKQVKEADKVGAEAKAKAELEGMFTDWDAESKRIQSELGFKLGDADINRIISKAPPKLQGYEPFQKAADNLKKKSPPPASSTPHGTFKDVMSLRKELNDSPEIKALKVASKKADQINALWSDYKAGKGSAQFSDQVFAVNFNKLIDETSAVMPGEFARMSEGAGLTDKIMASIKSAADGGLKFTDGQREEIVRVVNRLIDITRSQAKPIYDGYLKEASYIPGVDPSRVGSGLEHLFTVKATPEPKTQPTTSAQSYTSADDVAKAINDGTLKEGDVIDMGGKKVRVKKRAR